jgi:hypothetical protein
MSRVIACHMSHTSSNPIRRDHSSRVTNHVVAHRSSEQQDKCLNKTKASGHIVSVKRILETTQDHHDRIAPQYATKSTRWLWQPAVREASSTKGRHFAVDTERALERLSSSLLLLLCSYKKNRTASTRAAVLRDWNFCEPISVVATRTCSQCDK